MATIKLTITVEKLSNVLSLFDRIRVYRSTGGEGGPYAEITTPATRIVLAAGQSVYLYDDVAGDPTYFYKFSYYNETTFLESSLSEAIRGDEEALYVSLDEMRAEGVPASVSDDVLLSRIRTWQAFVERCTRLWFAPRAFEWVRDGNGTTLLQLPVPIVSVAALYLNGSSSAADPATYRVYAGRGESGRDDRRNPRIKLISGETSIFEGTGYLASTAVVFEVGEQNQVVDGTFGYVEADGSTPEPIKYAIKKLVARSSRGLYSVVGGGGSTAFGPIVEEETDRHRRRYGDPFVGSKMHSTTGDPEVDQILAAYRAPIKVGAPRTVRRRFGPRI